MRSTSRRRRTCRPGIRTSFAIAAVELAEGLVVLGQVAEGYGVVDLAVGAEVELVIETLYVDDSGDRTIWRWRPVSSSTATNGDNQ